MLVSFSRFKILEIRLTTKIAVAVLDIGEVCKDESRLLTCVHVFHDFDLKADSSSTGCFRSSFRSLMEYWFRPFNRKGGRPVLCTRRYRGQTDVASNEVHEGYWGNLKRDVFVPNLRGLTKLTSSGSVPTLSTENTGCQSVLMTLILQ